MAVIDGILMQGVRRLGGGELAIAGPGWRVRAVRVPGPAERTILFVPPLGENWTAWAQPMFRLARVASCVALDAPVGDRSGFAARVDSLLAAIEALGGPVLAVGASIGGLVAMRAARRRPEAFRAVLATALRPDLADLSGIRATLSVRSVEDVRRYLDRTWAVPPPTTAAALEKVLATMSTPEFRAGVEEGAACDLVLETKLAVEAGVALAFLYGADDALLAGQGGASVPAGVGVRRLEGCGHHPHYERLEETVAWIADAVRG